MKTENNKNEYGNPGDYWNIIARCTRLFFSTIEPGQLQALMAANDQIALVESLYARGTIASVVRHIMKRWRSGMKNFSELSNDMDDCVQSTTWALLVIAKKDMLKLDRTPGEVATYICQWIEQKVKRIMTKEFRHKLFLDEETKSIEDYQAPPAFDEILIARQAIRRDNAAEADIININEHVNRKKEEAALKGAGRKRRAKVLKMDKLRSRSHHVRSNNDSLGGLFGITGITKKTRSGAAVEN